MINYESLKQHAADLRGRGIHIKVSDLIALAPKNDPFYAGAPAQLRDGEWFAILYQQVAGGQSGVHLRRVHYRILDLPEEARRLPITISTSVTDALGRKQTVTIETYENLQRCWDYLTEAAKAARYLNLVPIDAFIDNRAKESSFSFLAHWSNPGDWDYEDPTPGYRVRVHHEDEFYTPWEGDLPDLPRLDGLPLLEELPYLEPAGYKQQQPYHIEIWVEKSEGEDVFLPLCHRYNVNFVPGVGDMSISTVYRFAERVRTAGRPAKLLYISDFDPSGFNMPVAVARKLEHFCRNYGFDDLDITLEPCMLTADQVDDYNLPPMPVKDSDGRKMAWEAQYGGAVELNAMFARDERILAARRIVEADILKYYDPELQQRSDAQRQRLAVRLDEEWELVRQDYETEWDQLTDDHGVLDDDWQALRDDFAALIEPFQARIDEYRSRLADINQRGQDLFARIESDLADIDLDAEAEYPLAEPEVETDTPDLLYHSRRNYWSQLSAYHEYKNNGSQPEIGGVLAALANLEEEQNHD